MMSQWRFASRLARREVQRRPGRTVLVMLLIALPIAAMVFASVSYRTSQDGASEKFTRRFGAADYAIENAATPTDIATFPTGTRVLRSAEVTVGVLPTDSLPAGWTMVSNLDLGDPMTRGMFRMDSGRAPRAAGEIVLTRTLARAWHAQPGTKLQWRRPQGAFTVVGVGVAVDNFRSEIVFVAGAVEQVVAASDERPGAISVNYTDRIDVPGVPTSADALRQFAHHTAGALQYSDRYGHPGSTKVKVAAIAWGWVVGALLLGIVGIIVSAAFATSARRQLVTLGQLAANGSPERLMRRTMVLQGAWSGVYGSGLGLVAGAALLISGRDQIESLTRHEIGPYQWGPALLAIIVVTGVIAAMTAAWFPARSAAKVSVLSALAGRRPMKSVPKRMVPIGAGLFGSGILILALVAAAAKSGSGNAAAAAAVLGGVLVLAGACCVSPAIVSILEPLAARIGGAARVAARSVGRARARSAAVVTALAVASAIAVASGTVVASRWPDEKNQLPYLPRNVVEIQHFLSPATEPSSELRSSEQFGAVPASVWSRFAAVLPAAKWVPQHHAEVSPKSIDPGRVGTRAESDLIQNGYVLVADSRVLAALHISARDQAALQTVGVMYFPPVQNTAEGDPQTAHSNPIVVETVRGTKRFDVTDARDRADSTRLEGQFVITESRAQKLGLSVVESGGYLVSPKPLSESQQVLVTQFTMDLQVEADGFGVGGQYGVTFESTGSKRPSAAEVQGIITAITLALALIVIAIALALAAAESRDERDVLIALGAKPKTMRRLAAWKAAVLTFAGGALAIPVGFLPVAAVLAASPKAIDRGVVRGTIFPWLTAVLLVSAIPLLAAIVGWVGSSVAQTVRPTRMSTLAND